MMDLAAIDPATVERVLLHGDLSKLTAAQKVSYVRYVCDRTGLDPLTQPFAYLFLNGREILYAKREATEQLRRNHKVSIHIVSRELVDDLYVVTARATLPDGRSDESIGAVPLAGLKGDARANACMKSETKAKRRVTLSICGLGMLDESEVESLPPVTDSDVPIGESPIETEALPPADLMVVKVETKDTKKHGVVRYKISFSDGRTATTIKDLMGSFAHECWKNHLPVRAVIKSTNWGPELEKLERADQPPAVQSDMLSSDDIPF
jgi:hypothetical protein